MTKLCGLCHKPLKTDDVVVVLLLAKFKEQEESYGLEVMAQTISSHAYCAQAKPIETTEVIPL